MKRIVASVGLVALGTSGVQAASSSAIVNDSAKPWSVSASLRGFYDDNVNTAPSGASLVLNGKQYERRTFGLEFSPSIILSWPWEQTSATVGYTYTLKAYQNKPFGNTDYFDHIHAFNAALDHSFSELYQVSARDSLVVGQEPDFLRADNNATASFNRIPGNNVRNYGNINFNAQLTRLLGLELGYANSYFNYADDQPIADGLGGVDFASLAGTLNRMEQAIHVDTRWKVQPETVGIVGYQFGWTDFTGDQPITPGPAPLESNDRNTRSHYAYVGVDHTFRPDLSGAVRVGGRFTDYYNADNTEVAPYVQLSLRYRYAAESYIEGGFTHDRSATDLIGPVDSNGQITLDSDTSVVYLSLTHKLAPNLFGSVLGQFQDSTYNGGAYDSQAERFYTAGVNLEYRFSRYLAAQVGYNYDRLDSDEAINRTFDRNRVYIGLTATY